MLTYRPHVHGRKLGESPGGPLSCRDPWGVVTAIKEGGKGREGKGREGKGRGWKRREGGHVLTHRPHVHGRKLGESPGGPLSCRDPWGSPIGDRLCMHGGARNVLGGGAVSVQCVRWGGAVSEGGGGGGRNRIKGRWPGWRPGGVNI